MNKYYTPDIEEFHVGFEYERWTGEVFEKAVVKNVFDIQNASVLLKEVQMRGVGWKIRVKYLDEQDIKDLGWIQIDTYEFEKSDFPSKYTLVVDDWGGEDFVYITEIVEGFEQDIFRGIIRNKSELKKLMKMLGNG